MLDLNKYNCLGEALRAALDRWPGEICLIESDRERENCRLTYRQFSEAALPLAAALQDAGLSSGTRVAILMTNQSKWLISAYAVFYCGGVLVPLDYKLPADDQLKLLVHSKAEYLIVEFHLWRAITKAEKFCELSARTVLVTEAPASAELAGAQRWEESRAGREPEFEARTQGSRLHRLFLGHGRTPEGLCFNARKLSGTGDCCGADFSVLARRALSQHHPDEPRHRFHGRLYHAFYRWWHSGSLAHAEAGIHPGCVYTLRDHVYGGGAADPKKSSARLNREIRGATSLQAASVKSTGCDESCVDEEQAAPEPQPQAAERHSRRFRRWPACVASGRCIHGTRDHRILP